MSRGQSNVSPLRQENYAYGNSIVFSLLYASITLENIEQIAT